MLGKLAAYKEEFNDGFKIEEISNKDIAIIGMAAKLPSSPDIDIFWKNIAEKTDCISELPPLRKKDTDEYLKYIEKGRGSFKYIKAGYIEDIDKFDYDFFKLTPKEAALMDPNQRLFLETAWTAIEDAGYGNGCLAGNATGVYVGYSSWPVYERLISMVEPQSLAIARAGNISSIIASRISFILDLKGPSMMIDTACSSSLVAIHLACRAIRNGECEQAIAGGVKVILYPVESEVKLGIESSDNMTRTFDDNSDGTGSGEGTAAILLKPLWKAVKDHDNIYAVIKGSAINQDGNSVGITAPNMASQADVIEKAYLDAGIDPATISYIEAHGTGTVLGDPIEVDAIRNAFSRYTDKKQFCAISSVKSNIGHLDNVAGIAGLIKAVQALRHRVLPPGMHFNKPNKKIDFSISPVYVNDRAIEWSNENFPRRCGISAFGLSGTNCHVVLEEYKNNENKESEHTREKHLLALSAINKDALNKLLLKYTAYLKSDGLPEISDICFTGNIGRGHYDHRIIFVLENTEDFRKKLQALNGYNPDIVLIDGVYTGTHIIVADKEKSRPNCITLREKSRLNEEAFLKVNAFVKTGDERILEDICRLYVKGADIPWRELYGNETRKRVRLPSYPFNKKRCWLDIPVEGFTVKGTDHAQFHRMGWKPCHIEKANQYTGHGCILVLDTADGKNSGICSEIINGLRTDGYSVITAHKGACYSKLNESEYIINGSEENYIKLLSEIKQRNLMQIIHLMTLCKDKEPESMEELEDALDSGLYSLFRLARALNESRITGTEIIFISKNAAWITGSEKKINPFNTAFLGFGKVVRQEMPAIKCRCIEIDEQTGYDVILNELHTASSVYNISYREGERYVEELQKFNIVQCPEKEIKIKENGTYIITGGTGGLGLEMAKHLSSKSRIRLALISRSAMPDRKKWDQALIDGKDDKLCKTIYYIKDIEASGTSVEFYSANVADMAAMKAVLDSIREKHSAINGIIHCAGVAPGGLIINKDEKGFMDAVSPKIQGTWILEKLTKQDSLDFFILFSSLASILGGQGQGDYTASNSCLDAYALYMDLNGRRSLSINWAAWRETGMAVGHISGVEGRLQPLSTLEALECFDIAAKSDRTNIIIGELNYDIITPEIEAGLPFSISGGIKEDIATWRSKKWTSHHEEPSEIRLKEAVLTGRETNAYNEVEKQVAKVWREVLGYEELNVDRSFFEIGGDSIKVSMVYTLLEKQFPGVATVADLFIYSTIAQIAEFICSNGSGNRNNKSFYSESNKLDNNMISMIDELKEGNLCIEEALERFKSL